MKVSKYQNLKFINNENERSCVNGQVAMCRRVRSPPVTNLPFHSGSASARCGEEIARSKARGCVPATPEIVPPRGAGPSTCF